MTPLFVIGATLEITLGRAFAFEPQLLAAIGFVAVFAGAANVPIACTVMGVELFGADAFGLFAVASLGAYVASARRGIYGATRHRLPKAGPLLARWHTGTDRRLEADEGLAGPLADGVSDDRQRSRTDLVAGHRPSARRRLGEDATPLVRRRPCRSSSSRSCRSASTTPAYTSPAMVCASGRFPSGSRPAGPTPGST